MAWFLPCLPVNHFLFLSCTYKTSVIHKINFPHFFSDYWFFCRSKDVLHDKPVSTNKLNHVYVTETIKIKSKLVESMPTGKSDCYRYLDDEKQLQKNAQG